MVYLASHGYRVLAPDMRGFGYSDAPDAVEDYDVFSILSDMICLLHEVGWSKVCLVGHDWGAAVAWLFALLEPDYFPSVVCLSVPWQVRKIESKDPIGRMKHMFGDMFFYILYHNEVFRGSRDHGPAESEYNSNPEETIYRIWTDPKSVPTEKPQNKTNGLRRDGGFLVHIGGRPKHLPSWLSQDEFDYVVEQYKHSGFRGGVNYYRNISRNFRLTPQLRGRHVKQPSMFILGEHDITIGFNPGGLKTVETNVKELCDDLRGFHVIRSEKNKSAGHWIMQERPDEINKLLHSFLRQVDGDMKSSGWEYSASSSSSSSSSGGGSSKRTRSKL
jgi:pimeloyl-ACP methyl ester carboxylesterase